MLKVASQPLVFGRTNNATWVIPFAWSVNGISAFAIGGAVSAKIAWNGGELPLTLGNGKIVWIDQGAGSFQLTISAADQIGVPTGDSSALWLYSTDGVGVIDAFAMYPLRIIEGPA